MKASLKGIELIKQFEGFSAKPYLCPANYLTIGYGHVITKKEKLGPHHSPLITKIQAEELLRQDLQKFESAVKKLISVPLTQNQFDALVSFTYNLGAGALQRSTLRQKINRKEHQLAATEFLKWVYADGRKLAGLLARRQAESTLYLT
jgi:lysozyme